MIIYIDEKTTDTQVKIETKTDLVKISFEGSKTLKDILTAVGFFNTKQGKIKFSKSLHTAVNSVFNDIYSIIVKNKRKKIMISGHSLGGGLAQVFAYLLTFDKIISGVNLVLTGSIRAGNKAFSKHLEGTCDSITWEEYGNDPVPLVYPWRSTVGSVTRKKKRSFPWLDLDLVNGDHVGYWS